WLFLPPEVSDYGAGHWAVLAALAAAGAALQWRDRGDFRQWGVTGDNFSAACRLLALPTAIMIAVPVVVAIWIGRGDFNLFKVAVAIVGYPWYALVQLLVFQLFLVGRLRRLGDSSGSIVAVSAGMFALLHWPNAVVMLACACLGAVCTWVYLRRPNLYALALSMGLAGAVFTQVLPHDVTHHMRVGPMYVYRLIQENPQPPRKRRSGSPRSLRSSRPDAADRSTPPK
ncbi:MAG: CPBP family intramembrane metalloprotease, partial [Planctomycetes bacterium]|nr:CPBP family intramembrane metalloprotease [Planctomycetota bacterium]